MIDIHSHVLPALDDGAPDLASAVEMCRMAARDGCTSILATPHQRTPTWWNCEPEVLSSGLDSLRRALGGEIEVLPGAEVRVDPMLLSALTAPDLNGIQPLSDSDYLLLEFNRRGLGEIDPEGLTQELRLAGWRPIFAHPEFIPDLARSPDLMHRMVETGALFQITAMSLTGGFGKRVAAVANAMVRRELIHFAASDAHGLARRPPGLSRAFGHLKQEHGEALARRLTSENPAAVLANRAIEGH